MRGGGQGVMEVNAFTQSPTAFRADRTGELRNEALAQKRREISQEQLARAEDSRARAADQLSELREAVARIIGANTRLSISRSENSLGFVYRAIDVETGEVVNEWPQDTFLDLVRGVREDVKTDVEAGLMLDQVA